MAVLEQEHGILGPRPRSPIERNVFAADGARRTWLLRLAGLGTAALSFVWLAALGVAMLGAGRLPDVPLSDAQVPRVSEATTNEESLFARPGRPVPQSAVTALSLSRALRASAQAAAERAPGPAVLPKADPLPSEPARPPEPSTSHQGWARRGWTAPPGQAKRHEPVPRGRSAHTDSATTNTTATTKQGSPHGPKKG
jgi:hypothetical protein